MSDITCTQCGSSFGIIKYGKSRAGKQKYRCIDAGCGHQFVVDSDHYVDTATRDRVIKLLAAGVHPKQITQVETGISLRWIYELRRRM